jgi:hypothetical protein
MEIQLGQGPLESYSVDSDFEWVLVLQVRYLPNGGITFVRVRANAESSFRLDYCAGPALFRVGTDSDIDTLFKRGDRTLDFEESRLIRELSEPPLRVLQSLVRDGAPCQLVLRSGGERISRGSFNLSGLNEEEKALDMVRLVEHLLQLISHDAH